jgi:protease I
MKKIVIITGDAGESLEVYYPLHRLQEEGWEVTVASPTKKTLQLVVHDFEPGFETYTEKAGYRIESQAAIKDLEVEDYDGLVISGGRAPEYIRNEAGVTEFTRAFIESGKPVAGTCHAGLILSKAGVLSGKTCTAYPALACDIEAAGGKFVDREVVVDGNLITARAWPDNPAWMREFIAAVKG